MLNPHFGITLTSAARTMGLLSCETKANSMRFISLTWTDGLPQTEAILVVRTVHEAILQARQQWPVRGNIIEVPEIKPFGYWVLQGAEPDQVYGSMEWYINKSFDQESQQLLGRRYLQLVLDEPWQHQTPHYDLAAVHQPLFDEVDQHGVFGLAVRGRAAVLSVYPLHALTKDRDATGSCGGWWPTILDK